jgi:hypothetical protein
VRDCSRCHPCHQSLVHSARPHASDVVLRFAEQSSNSPTDASIHSTACTLLLSLSLPLFHRLSQTTLFSVQPASRRSFPPLRSNASSLCSESDAPPSHCMLAHGASQGQRATSVSRSSTHYRRSPWQPSLLPILPLQLMQHQATLSLLLLHLSWSTRLFFLHPPPSPLSRLQ